MLDAATLINLVPRRTAACIHNDTDFSISMLEELIETRGARIFGVSDVEEDGGWSVILTELVEPLDPDGGIAAANGRPGTTIVEQTPQLILQEAEALHLLVSLNCFLLD